MMLNFPLINQLNISSQEEMARIIEMLKNTTANEDEGSNTEVKQEQSSKKGFTRDLD